MQEGSGTETRLSGDLILYIQWSGWQNRYFDCYRHCSRAGCQGRDGGYCWDSLQDERPEDGDGCCKTGIIIWMDKQILVAHVCL